MKKLLLLAAFGFLTLGSYAQSLNLVKNIQVKGIYDFQTKFNEYRLNSYLKYRLEEYGFNVYYDKEEAPAEVKADPCNQFKCIVEKGKSMLATQLIIKFVDCKGAVVFTAEGESRLKKRDKSHVDAIKKALEYSTLNRLKN